MFKQHGDFGAMEVQISKKHVKSKADCIGGGWYTRAYLESQAKWTKRLNWRYMDNIF